MGSAVLGPRLGFRPFCRNSQYNFLSFSSVVQTGCLDVPAKFHENIVTFEAFMGHCTHFGLA